MLEKRAESAASFNAWKESKKGTLANKAKEEAKKKKKLKEEQEEEMMKKIHAKKVRLRSNNFWADGLMVF